MAAQQEHSSNLLETRGKHGANLEDANHGKACSTQEMEAAIQGLTTILTQELRKIQSQLETVSRASVPQNFTRSNFTPTNSTNCDRAQADVKAVAPPRKEGGGGGTSNETRVDFDMSINPKVKAELEAKISLAHDQDVDASDLVLRDNQSLGAIFNIDVDKIKKPHCVEEFYKEGPLKQFLMGAVFQHTVVAVIILNVVYLAVESDKNDEDNIYRSDWFFLAADQFFAIFFTAELALRFFAFAEKRDCFRDGWFKFDLFLVLTMLLELWILMPILYAITTEGSKSKIQVPTQPLRIVRLLKLARMARLMKAIPELVTMINGLCQALRAIFSTMLLVGLMVYAWSILLLMFMKDDDEFNSYLKYKYHYQFDSIVDCMWALMMCGTLMLDNTGLIATDLLYSGDWGRVATAISFVLYSCLSNLLILQMLIGVLCDVVSRVGSDRDDAEAIGLMKQEILGDLMECDNGDGKISRSELLIVLESKTSKTLFKKLNINRLFLTSIASLMFRDAETPVPIADVLDLIMTCQGENTATVKIIASALCFLSDEITHLHDNMHVNFKVLGGGVSQTVPRLSGLSRSMSQDTMTV